MAGERFKFLGFTEVIAVCTHPDYRRRGYAAALTIAVASRIAAVRPFPSVAVRKSPGMQARSLEMMAWQLDHSHGGGPGFATFECNALQ